jgi:uncharacterized membrane protein YfcA
MWFLAVFYGITFGLAFGLTGVGSVFAVPLLVYDLALPPHQAVCVSMLAVTLLSASLTAWRGRRAALEWHAGAIMAAPGMLGAPLGAGLGRLLSGKWLMVLFAVFVALVAARMLFTRREPSLPGAHALAAQGSHTLGLALAGFASGILAGLLGVGGLLIVPSLVLLGGIEIHRAIATSLLVICAIGTAAIASHLSAGQSIPSMPTTLFIAGGASGMAMGLRIGNRLSQRRLETVFALLMLGVAFFIFERSLR